MTYLMAYFIIKLTDMVILFGGIGFIGSMVGMIIYIVGIAGSTERGGLFNGIDEKNKSIIKKMGRNLSIIGCILFFLGSMLPTTKQAAAIYILPSIVNNEDLQETIKQIPELSNLGLQHLKEILSDDIKEQVKKEIIN